MTCRGSPLIEIVLPTMPGSPPYCPCHRPYPRTTGPSIRLSSSAEKVRPRSGETPTSGTRLAVTRAPLTSRGAAPPVSVLETRPYAPIASKLRLCAPVEKCGRCDALLGRPAERGEVL